jgi:hypothetical protein
MDEMLVGDDILMRRIPVFLEKLKAVVRRDHGSGVWTRMCGCLRGSMRTTTSRRGRRSLSSPGLVWARARSFTQCLYAVRAQPHAQSRSSPACNSTCHAGILGASCSTLLRIPGRREAGDVFGIEGAGGGVQWGSKSIEGV